MPVLVLVALVSLLHHDGLPRMAATLALGFAACLRTEEMVALVVHFTYRALGHVQNDETKARARAHRH